MPEPLLTKEQMQGLLKFKGYGNPAGRFWFIGMEEGGSNPWDELAGRADKWDEIEDLARVCRPWAPNLDLTKRITPTWWLMCRVVGRLSGKPWRDTDFVRCYQSTRLGRRDGETFLTEILPLPKKNIGDWPYASLYASRKVYEAAVLPRRIAELRDLFDKHSPEYVFCYGKGFWPHHKNVFRDAEFTSILDGKARIAMVGRSTIVLTAFFDPTIVGKVEVFVERLGHEVETARASSSSP